jgi:hypothetical protein
VRATEWQAVKSRLEYSGRHTKKEIKVFEIFFIKGQEPDWEQKGDDPIPLIYRLWFSPDHGKDAWQKIVDKVFSYHSWQAKNSIHESRKILSEEAGSDRYCGVDGAPVGFMGGLEEKIFNFLTGNFETGVFLSFEGERLYEVGVFNISYYLSLLRWLEKNENANPFNLFHYAHEFWYAAMSDGSVKKVVQDGKGDFVKKYFSLVAQYISRNEVSDLDRLEHCRKIFEILEGRKIPALFADWWAAAKVEAKV